MGGLVLPVQGYLFKTELGIALSALQKSAIPMKFLRNKIFDNIFLAIGFGPYSALAKRAKINIPEIKLQARAIPYMFDMDGESW